MELKTMYRILTVTVFCLLMSVGVYIGLEVSNKKETPSAEVVVSNTDNINIYDEQITDEPVKTTEIDVKFNDVYPECGHSIESKEHYENTTFDDVKKNIEKKDLGYKLIGEKDGVLMYEKVHTGKCMNHYKVCLENNLVVIYRMSETGDFKLYQETEITSQMLREGIVEQLQEGIIVDDIEELFFLMEDIES